ncbi:MAG TPA: Mur ligase domain-containing protein [Candidatus Saccharimonadales bacterium]|nr:Mur ligase domain-containing protein [Candidatus Saccharimonadales bacterium]
MHVFFSGIGGVGISPLASIAKQLGHEVSGSDKQHSQYLDSLKAQGISELFVGQSVEQIDALHAKKPIDWYVYSSAVKEENPELVYARSKGIKVSKRGEFINHVIKEKRLKLIAIAGTHGKTTTTAMVAWLFKQLDVPISYLVGTKVSFGDMGQYEDKSEYFVYECDEFDRNFLAFEPYIGVISGVSWDHHEIYPTREDYKKAFREFISHSKWTILWQDDAEYLGLAETGSISVQDSSNIQIQHINLRGKYNRLDGWLAIQAIHEVTNTPIEQLVKLIAGFPALHRRMEEIVPGLYSDEAHTPDKIRGAMSVALETSSSNQRRQSLTDGKEQASTASESYQKAYGERGAEKVTKSDAKRTPSGNVVVVYEPLTNRRQHHMINDYGDCFKGAKKVYWIPSYLAREDPKDRIIPPAELISHLADPSIAEAAKRDEKLKSVIAKHLKNGDTVVAMAGGGGDSLDEWARENFKK